MSRVRLRLTKGAEARFISHLDLARALERAVRRARLPLAYSEGFNPHPKISICSALALGATSEGELVEIELKEPVAVLDVARSLNGQLPAGLEVTAARDVTGGGPSLQSLMQWASYRLVMEAPGFAGNINAWEEAVTRLMADRSCPVEREVRAGGANAKVEKRVVDIRPLVGRLEVLGAEGDGVKVFALVRAGSGANLRPEELAAGLGRYLGAERVFLRDVHRLELWGDGFVGPTSLWEG